MTIETTIHYKGAIIRDRIFISELELAQLRSEVRPEIIHTAKRICAVRCIQKWRHAILHAQQCQ
jgi:hypothetical protein